MKNEGTTKKEQEELLLRETKKTLQKELAHFKGRKILTPEELLKMKEASQWWDERGYKKWTPLEELQFEFYRDKQWLLRPVIESMVFHVKPGPYDQYLKELEGFNIDVRGLLLRIRKLEEKRDSLYNRVNELQDQLISSMEGNVKLLDLKIKEQELNATIKEQDATIEEETYRIRHSDDYDEHMEAQLQDILSGSEPRE